MPPDSFWLAAHAHLDRADELVSLARAADDYQRPHFATALWYKAADAGHPDALAHTARHQDAQGHYTEAEHLARQAARAGNPDALLHLAWRRIDAGHHDQAARITHQAADAGHPDADHLLVWLAEQTDLPDTAERLRQMSDATPPDGSSHSEGSNSPGVSFAGKSTDTDGPHAAEQLAHTHHDTNALLQLAWLHTEAGNHRHAHTLAQQAAHAGNSHATHLLAHLQHPRPPHPPLA
ncbi:hypothetical protein O3Q52_45345 [Streptomyces sp. ActVer]|uniref:hypothetical protein n=1 Tax=Streptomyces sp. ActVer TaxID=3014558 RepID=UPI0022B57B0E|nr:hypothetical protein [Streptomyces sp. ActVer]MCZ4515222.1 hypothetical protein [Streptomyces sp. ActVer]